MQTIANDNIARRGFFAEKIALAPDDAGTEAALSGFIVALARNQARIDHLEATGAANDNTMH
ncbi:hypothetical protein [Bradyrhizobium sp. Bra64]|uniref:hypothetical protein n=1 Tax=Bradyrhizobium sp. Bra64 TaxID=2926009 RepID=UPI0021185E85|nr:hypothetical protein [Bradyrhizobium sp. Bra64]